MAVVGFGAGGNMTPQQQGATPYAPITPTPQSGFDSGSGQRHAVSPYGQLLAAPPPEWQVLDLFITACFLDLNLLAIEDHSSRRIILRAQF